MPNYNKLQGLFGDFAQGASNSVASNVSAPVDAIAWLLRKLGAGGIIGDAPVGGSAWMAQQGLTADPKNKLAGLLGESVGLSGPMVAAAKAPQIASGLLRGAENLAKPNILNPQTGAVVYHGSPHLFPPTAKNQLGEFDFSKIGTGEGSQAYGHGGYLADREATGRAYKEALEGANYAYINGVPIKNDATLTLAIEALHSGKNPKTYLEQLRGMNPGAGRDYDVAITRLGEAAKLPGTSYGPNPGYLYKVDLPDEKIAKMLDWDKQLYQQSKDVQDAIRTAYPSSLSTLAPTMSLIKEQLTAGPMAAEVAAKLKRAGIPGIRYLDGGSRGAGTGTSNYVVFPGEENALKILERNGKGLLNP